MSSGEHFECHIREKDLVAYSDIWTLDSETGNHEGHPELHQYHEMKTITELRLWRKMFPPTVLKYCYRFQLCWNLFFGGIL